MAQYTAVFTTYGTQQLAKAIANNNPLTVTHFAVGDGNGNAVTVSASQERLVNEKYRATISAVSLDPRNNKQVVFELTIPENVGGFYIREMGVFDAQNKLIAYANCPESFKPTLASGSGKVQVMRMILLVASSNAVTLTVDDSVIFVTRGQLTPKTITANSANGFDNTGHSHAIDKASTTKAGIVQLTSDTGLDSENLGLTAKAGKKLAQLIATVQLALNNYIPNNKKSSAVNSNSNDTVATSAAVKTAYDKGVEAKQAADGAQRTANDGVAKANAAQNSADNAQRSANDGINRANNAQNSANDGINLANNAQMTAEAANRNANTRVVKSGDTMTGNLVIDSQSNAWSGVALKNKQNKYLVYEVTPDSESYFGSMIYRDGAGHNINHLRLPKRNGEIALKEDIDGKVSKSGDTMTGNLTVPNLIVNDPTNNNNFVQIGDDTKLIDVDMGHTVGLQATDNANDAYIAYGATKKRFGFDGNMFFADSALATNYIGHGSYAQQYNVAAPFYVHQTLSVARDTYHPFVKGRVRAAGQYGAAFSFGYTTNQRQDGDGFGAGVIHLIEDNGAELGWFFNHDGIFTSPGDVVTGDGKRLTKAHQTNYSYVETTAAAAIWGGLKINRNGDHMLIESNDRGGFNFIRRNNDGGNVYALSSPTKNGTLATLEDLPIERLIWQGSTDNPITVNAQVSKGVLFVLMDTPHGANANRPIWFSAPIEQCHDTRIGEYDTGGTAGDYNYVTLALLHRNGNNITITPQSDGRKPRIKKVVVFG